MYSQSRRIRKVSIDPRRLFTALQGSLVSISSDLPQDTEYVGFNFDFSTNSCFFVVSSNSFEEITEGSIIPEFSGNILIKEV